MRIVIEPDVQTFAAPGRGLSWLERDAVLNTLPATIARGALAGLGRHTAPPLWISVEADDGQVIGAMLRTPPWPIVVPAISLELARELAGFVATGGAGDDHRALPGVNGPVEPARAFADRWTELTGLKVTTGRNTRLYRLAELVWPSDVPGRFRLAGQADLDLCVAWFEAFADEAHNDDTPRPERADVVARVGANSERLGLWVVNEVPVCMVGWTLPASGVVRVGPVYTPPESRRRGYGAAATAAASALILESGAQVCLFTDLANPTSNSIYQKIGYHPVTDFIELVFE